MLHVNSLELIEFKKYIYEIGSRGNQLILIYMYLKAYRLSELIFFYLLKVANIRCFILIAVEIFHNIIRK
jgi:hypothetical protein